MTLARKRGRRRTRAHRRRHRRRPPPAARRADRRRATRSRNMDTGEPLATVRDRVLSANAYIGAAPIVEALRQGANVVITGRSTDTALTMAPLLHEFGWERDDWDRLAAGIVAGHIIECGAQCSGGNCLVRLAQHSRPRRTSAIRSSKRSADGTFVVTKHPGTGGRISRRTVTEQLVYEMGDPHAYITPDVIADFTSIQLERRRRRSRARVRHQGPRRRPTSSRCRSRTAPGSRPSARSCTSWPDALEKAQLADRDPARAPRPPRPAVRPDAHRVRRRERDARPARRRRGATRPRCSCASACAATTARPSSGSRARSRRSCSTGRRASPASPAAARRSRRSSPTGRR